MAEKVIEFFMAWDNYLIRFTKIDLTFGTVLSLDKKAVQVLKKLKFLFAFENHKYGIYLGVRIFSNSVSIEKSQVSISFGCCNFFAIFSQKKLQRKKFRQELNPDHLGESQMSSPLDHEICLEIPLKIQEI